MASKLKWINHKSTFFDILKAQRGTSKYTDATLAVDGNFYPVHKLVMSTCSDYFSEIFERTECKAPVIVLKDVQCHDIEALLDYMYVGEVDVEQDKLASLLKTAESLKIKGLGVPEKSQTKSYNNSVSSDDDPCAKPNSPPAKKRKHDDSNITWPSSFEKERTRLDSNTALVNPNQPQTSSITSPNIRTESEPMVVKVELDDSLEGEVNLRKDNVYAADIVETVHDPVDGSGYDVIKKEHEPEDFDFTSVPGPSAQKFTESDTIQKESLVVKVGLAGTSNDPLGGDNASAVFNTEQNQGYYGSTSAPGAFLPQNSDSSEVSISKTTNNTKKNYYEKFEDIKKECALLKENAIIAVIFIPSPREVLTAGHPAITDLVRKHLPELENDPRMMQSYKESIVSPPMKPLKSMTYWEAKKFVTNLLTATLGFRKGFGDLHNKPEWYPSELWNTKVLNKKESGKSRMNLEDFRTIISSYFHYYGVTLPANTAQDVQQHSTMNQSQKPEEPESPLVIQTRCCPATTLDSSQHMFPATINGTSDPPLPVTTIGAYGPLPPTISTGASVPPLPVTTIGAYGPLPPPTTSAGTSGPPLPVTTIGAYGPLQSPKSEFERMMF